MRMWVLRFLALSACVVVIAVGVIVWILRGSLPDLEGTIVSGLIDAPASIERDAAGVPVITASTRADLAFATGVAHAQDRYFQMDLVRRQAAGELSALFGPVALDADRYYRFHRFRSVAREVLERLPKEHRRLLDSYAEGVNTGLASLESQPFEYYVLNTRPMPWTAEDSLLVVYAMFLQLNDSRARFDLRHGLAHRVLPEEVYAWLFPDGTPWDAPLAGDVRHPRPWPPAELFTLSNSAATPVSFAATEPAPILGSNNWAVGGALSRTGHAMVANDMHLGLGVPNIWYRARLVQTGSAARDVTGVTLPGVPLLVAGSNGHVAWGFTNSYGDWTDAVVVIPGETVGTYRTAEGDRRFVLHHETIEVAGEGDVDYTVRETIWGPVDETVAYPEGEIAVSWTAHHARAVNMNLLALETARSAEAALDIANTAGIPPQNFVTGDAAGNIGWTIAGQVPVRRGYAPGRPADWSRTPGWTGWLDSPQYPRILNPPDARLWTANARVVDGEDLEAIGDGGYDLGARAKQIRDALRARQSFTEQDMLDIQTDDRALFLAPWRELLLDLLDTGDAADDVGLIEYRELVRNWAARATPDSAGYRLVRQFRLEVRSRVFDGLLAGVRAEYDALPAWTIDAQFEAPLWQLVTERPPHLLPAGYDSWESLLLAAVHANLEEWDAEYGTPLDERTWGELNKLSMRHPLSASLPLIGNWLDMPAQPMAGDANMPRAQGADWGASQRIVVSPGDEANGLMHMPGGQSGHPLSQFYRAGHDAWVQGEPLPFLPGPALYTLKLLPGQGKMAASGEHSGG
jgi:penicillin G amidase